MYDLRGAPLDAWDRAERFHGWREWCDLGFDRGGELGDRFVEEVDVGEDPSDDDRVLGLEPALQRLAERRKFRAKLPERQISEDFGVGGAGDQRGEHRPAGLAEQVRGDAVELDAGVFHQLVQSSGFALAVPDLSLAVAGQVPQRPDRLGRHQTPAEQPGLGEAAQPLRVGHIGLSPGDLLHVTGVDQRAREPVFQDRPDRFPIDTRGLHRDVRDAVCLKPVGQHEQSGDGRGEGRDILDPLPGLSRKAHARGHACLVDIESADTLNNNFHETSRSWTLTVAARREPRLLVDTEERARGTIPGFRARLPRQTVCGLKSTKKLDDDGRANAGRMPGRRHTVQA